MTVPAMEQSVAAVEAPSVRVEEAAAAAQAKPATTPTTFKSLMAKRRRRDVLKIPTWDENGEPTELVIKLQAIGGVEYDDLISHHRPTTQQKNDGAIYNIDTFAPALVSATTIDPALTYQEAMQLWNSDEWSGGELSAWFGACLRINNGGVDLPFSASA